MRAGWGIWALGLCLLHAPGALAAPGLGGKVYAPYVTKGIELEVFGGRLTGGPENGESAVKAEIEYGFSDRFALAVLAELEDEPSEDARLEAVAIEAIGEIGSILGIDTSLYLEYEQRLHNRSGVGEIKLLLAKELGPLKTLLNLDAKHAFTDRDGEGGTKFQYAASALVDLDVIDNLQVGIEAFGDLGTNRHFGGLQEHYVGPVAKWEFRPMGLREIELKGGYLFPAGAATSKSDGQIRFELEVEF